ncbi:MAG: MlaD family protein [Planctomycetaceae bacterium]|nr:MlaD family protein [Planctomycetaceae bacterium]
MNNQHIKIRIGIVCVGFLIATVVLVMLFGGGKMPRWFGSDYEIYVLLKQAPMLSENSPVYKNGVEIGRVTRVQLVENDRMVEITARIKGNIKLYTNEDCYLSLNLLGQSTLNFTPNADLPLGEMLLPKSTIYGIPPMDLTRMADVLQGDASKAMRSVAEMADEVKNVLIVVNRIIGTPEEVAQKQQQLQEMVERTSQTLTLVKSVLGSVEELISDPDIKQGIKTSSTQLPGLIDEGKKLMANVNDMSDRFASLLQRVDNTIEKVDGNLDNITRLTEALGEDGPQFVSALASAAQEFDAGMAQLYDFTRSLNNPDGSLGRLLNDPEFFQTVTGTLRNADQTIKNIQRLTVQLQPILKDFNVFSDKLAREPGLLGLKGIFDKSPPTKGLPDAYSNPWQLGRNNGVPQQQSQRIQLIRTPQWPHGVQQYRNEPVPVQNRYASQVIDLPDSPYDDAWYDNSVPTEMYYENLSLERIPYWFGDTTPTKQRPTGAEKLQTNFQTALEPLEPVAPTLGNHIPQRDRVILMPVHVVSPQYAEPISEPVWIHASHSPPRGTSLEIDFAPEATAPYRLASGNVSTAPPIIQPLHGKTESTGTQENHPSQTAAAKPERRPEIKVPNFKPTF